MLDFRVSFCRKLSFLTLTYQVLPRSSRIHTVDGENVNENLRALWLGDKSVAKWSKVVRLLHACGDERV